jgi:hypothetical protein
MSVSSDTPLPVTSGQVRRHELHGSFATYVVCQVEGALALVEVVEAPGLAAGMRFRFATAAVAAMTLVPSTAATPARASRFARTLAV